MRSVDLGALAPILVLALASGALSAAAALSARLPLGVVLVFFAAGVVLGVHAWSEGGARATHGVDHP